MTDRLDVDQLTDADHRRLWLEVIRQAAADAQSMNGHRADAVEFLESDRAVAIFAEAAGTTPTRASAALRRAVARDPAKDTDSL